MGMVAEARVAERLGWIDEEVTSRLVALLERLGLPTSAPGLDPDALIDAMGRDKKNRGGRIRFVLPRRLGSRRTDRRADRGDRPRRPRRGHLIAQSSGVTDDELRDLLCLTMVPGVGPQTCSALLDRFKTAGRALDASMKALKEVDGVGPKLAERIAGRDASSTPRPSWHCAESTT